MKGKKDVQERNQPFDYSINVWDFDDNNFEKQKLQEHVDRVCCVSFSPDDRKIASGGYDNTIKVFWLDPEEPPEYMTVPIKHYLPPKKDGKSSFFSKSACCLVPKVIEGICF